MCLCTWASEVRAPYHRPSFLSGHPDDFHLASTHGPVSNFGEVLLQAPAVMGAARAEAVVGVITLILVCSQAKMGRGEHRESTGQHSNPASHLFSSSWGFSSLTLGKNRGAGGRKR